MPIEDFFSFTRKIVQENGTQAQKKQQLSDRNEVLIYQMLCQNSDHKEEVPWQKTNFWITTMFPKVAKHIGGIISPPGVHQVANIISPPGVVV